MYKDDCIFCLISQKKSPAHIVWENDSHLAFLSIFPNTQGVTVVIPKEHKPSYIFENNNEDITQQIIFSKEVAHKLDTFFEDSSRSGVVFEGFGVDHLHTKLYPLHGTGNLAEWKKIESTNNNTYFEMYPGFISTNDSHRASDETLAKLAGDIRKINKNS